MEKIKTASGREFECDYVSTIPNPARAFVRILNTPLATVAAVFSSKAETMQMVCGSNILNRYTRLVAIVPEMDAAKVVLDKE